MSGYRSLIQKRRTFAIISHPDAGKTTLVEEFLLHGGAIVLAGSVKGEKDSRHTVSDWVEIGKQRGISVTSSILQSQYKRYCINIPGTPGRQDFSEDMCCTLMAVDSAVIVIDALKGVETQTRKLFRVCLLRDILIFTFINKMDREAHNPFNLLEEIEQELGIEAYLINWPVGCGKEFKGVYDRNSNRITPFHGDSNKHETEAIVSDLDDPGLKDLIGLYLYEQLCDDIELLDGAGYELNMDAVRYGRLSPAFFGSALTNSGVEPLLEGFLRMTSSPLPRKTTDGEVDPFDPDSSASVFKVQANMNKIHRDRITSMRICSDKFKKNMEVLHQREDKKIKLSQSQQIMAQEYETIKEAYAGGIIGVFDPGIFSIGDTLCAFGRKILSEGTPTFVSKYFVRVHQTDTMKRKQFAKGVSQITQEGTIQVFQELEDGMEEVIVDVVGVLQFDALKYCSSHEYDVDTRLESLLYQCIRWISNDAADPKTLMVTSDTKKTQDPKGYHLLLLVNEWNIRWALERNEGLELTDSNHGQGSYYLKRFKSTVGDFLLFVENRDSRL